jgi:hypothetical protein
MKYKSVGIPEEDLTPPESKIIPDRVQKLIDLYRRNYIAYPWNREDENERVFEYRRTLQPNTYSYSIEAIYRVRDPADKSKEYYFYQKKGKVLNDNDEPEYTNSLTYGYAIEPVHELRYNPKVKRKEPFKIRDDPIYQFAWNPKEVRKLLDGSEIPCSNLYIGTAYAKGQGTLGPATDILSIKNKDDFLNGNFDQLVLLNKAGMMNVEQSTLHLIDKARDRFEEEQLRRIALASTPTSQQLQEQRRS